jgi:4-hydroxybenzoate polyprenyltransferase
VDVTESTEAGRRPLAAAAALVRLPNLFTAPPDVVLGAALVAAAGHAVRVEPIAGLAAASVLLYAAGTTLNDYFDAAEDARERPERPIPAGEISRRGALALGVGLLTGGVVVALVAAGAAAGAVAGGLALAVLLYDGAFKGSTLGFLFMGSARGLNVLLGTTAGGVPLTSLPSEALAVPAVVLCYVAGVTYMAEGETGSGSRSAVLVATGGVAVATVGFLGRLLVDEPSRLAAALAVVLLVGFLGWVGRPLRAAYDNPVPGTVGPAVGACVLGLPLLDAAFAATVGPVWAFATLAFLVPAVGFSRAFDVT